MHFKLAVACLIQLPARLLKQQVDVEVARFGLVVVVRIGGGRVGGFGGGYLGAQLRQLGVQRGGFLLGSSQRGIARGQVVSQGSQLLQRGLRGLGGGLPGSHVRGAGQQLRTELQRRVGPCGYMAAIVARQPKGHLKQLAQYGRGVSGRDGPRTVHRVVALLAHHVHLGVQCGADQHLETGLKQKGRQVRLVGHLQLATAPAFGLEQPHHRQLQRAPGVKAGGARVGQRGLFGLARLGKQRGPFGLQE